MKPLLTILTLFFSTLLFCQDSIKVKITRIETKDSVTYVTMKTKYAIYKTSCKCVVPYKEKQIIYIKKP